MKTFINDFSYIKKGSLNVLVWDNYFNTWISVFSKEEVINRPVIIYYEKN